jgi:hypothetical protein
MPHFYFHFTMDDEYVPDLIGRKCTDLGAAHSHAVMLAGRVMSYCEERRAQSDGWCGWTSTTPFRSSVSEHAGSANLPQYR